MNHLRLGILTSHPIQYYAPWFRQLAQQVDLQVFFAHRQDATGQAAAGFGVKFEWDVPLTEGYPHRWLKNVSVHPGLGSFGGCDTPEIYDIVAGKLKAEMQKPKAETSDSQKSDFSFQLSTFSVSPFDAFLIMGWNRKSYVQAIRACRRNRIPVLMRGDSQLNTPRSRLTTLVKYLPYRWILPRLDGHLYVGQRNREYLRHYGVPESRLFFTPHFVDNEWFGARAEEVRASPLRLDRGESDATLAHRISFSASDGEKVAKPDEVFPGSGAGQGVRALGDVSNPSPNSQLPSPVSALRKQWGAEEGDLVALFVGKFIPKKRPADLLRALAVFQSQSGRADLPVGPDARQRVPTMLAVVVGAGEMENELRAFAARENVRAHFAGFKNQTELPQYYAGADVLVLPSDGGETWGLVVNEAMACGLPAVVSDAAGCAPDMIEEGLTGFTYPMADVNALADRLVRVRQALKENPARLREAVRRKATAYSMERATAGLLQACDAVLARRPECV